MAHTLDPRLQKLKAQVKKKPVSKSTPKKKELAKVEKKPEIAYVLKDKTFGELVVKASANAWWMEIGKVELVINAFKYRANKLQASVAAGISHDQLDYFIETHPEFSDIIARCKEVSSLKAKQTLVQALDKDLTTVRWFLETTDPAEFGKKPPLVAVQINMHERVGEDREQYNK